MVSHGADGVKGPRSHAKFLVVNNLLMLLSRVGARILLLLEWLSMRVRYFICKKLRIYQLRPLPPPLGGCQRLIRRAIIWEVDFLFSQLSTYRKWFVLLEQAIIRLNAVSPKFSLCGQKQNNDCNEGKKWQRTYHWKLWHLGMSTAQYVGRMEKMFFSSVWSGIRRKQARSKIRGSRMGDNDNENHEMRTIHFILLYKHFIERFPSCRTHSSLQSYDHLIVYPIWTRGYFGFKSVPWEIRPFWLTKWFFFNSAPKKLFGRVCTMY